MNLTTIQCKHCGAENKRNASNCIACYEALGPVNVNIYSDPYFQDGLKAKYDKVIAEIEAKGKRTEVENFESEIISKGKAVINMDAKLLFKMVNEREEYLSYQRGVEQSKRQVAEFENDLKRCVVEVAFYGIHGKSIVYAALSLNDFGLYSYGDVSVLLKTVQIEKRTTVFERNSYHLYDGLVKKGWKAGTIMPLGHCGTWNERQIVTVNKLGLELAVLRKKPNFASLILKSDGKRIDEEFIELHIFGTISGVNIEKATFQKKARTKFSKLELKLLKVQLQVHSIEIKGL